MKNKRKSLIEAERRMEELLIRVGYTGKNKGRSVNEIPNYRVESNLPKTSDTIPGNTPRKFQNTYSGNEIMGISVMHKSNLVPIRRDNKEAAIEVAQMRRN